MWECVKSSLGIGILDDAIGNAETLVRRALPDLEPLVLPSGWWLTVSSRQAGAFAWYSTSWPQS